MASTTLITDMKSAISTGPSATSETNAVTASKELMDLDGTLGIILLKLNEAKVLLNTVVNTVLDGSDPIKTGLNGVLQSLS